MENDLEAFFATAKVDIEKRLREIISTHEEKKKLEYLLQGGKRIRSMLCLLVFKVCNGGTGDYDRALDLAAAIELQHSASLVHDDIIDGDVSRRGCPSYYKTYGIEDAILTGHIAIVLGFKNVLNHGPKIIKTLYDIWDESLKGEIKDIESRKNAMALIASGERLYFEIILNKTASLFAGAAKVGSQEAMAPESLQQLFWEYGKHIGVAYQLADDSHDIGNGIETLPLAWIYKQLDNPTKESFIAGMEKGDLLPSKILTDLGVDTRQLFMKEITKMQHAAEAMAKHRMIPRNEFKPLLLEVPTFIIKECMAN